MKVEKELEGFGGHSSNSTYPDKLTMGGVQSYVVLQLTFSKIS